MPHFLPSPRRALAVTALLVALVATVALAPSAGARGTTTAVVPNGTYGVLGPRGEYVVFVVRDRKVNDLNFNIQITCQASDSPTSEQRFFSAGAEAPQGRRIPANGKLILNWRERGNGRLGQVHVELKFGVRDIANFAVIVPEEPSPEPVAGEALESCDGVSAQRFHRGFELPPLPY
jgi:hypothetical protein